MPARTPCGRNLAGCDSKSSHNSVHFTHPPCSRATTGTEKLTLPHRNRDHQTFGAVRTDACNKHPYFIDDSEREQQLKLEWSMDSREQHALPLARSGSPNLK